MLSLKIGPRVPEAYKWQSAELNPTMDILMKKIFEIFIDFNDLEFFAITFCKKIFFFFLCGPQASVEKLGHMGWAPHHRSRENVDSTNVYKSQYIQAV
jgi:hypothetical protein